jgi:hypothetical protein
VYDHPLKFKGVRKVLLEPRMRVIIERAKVRYVTCVDKYLACFIKGVETMLCQAK